jgi:hypothetical protein
MTSSKAAARAAIALGTLAVLAIPLGVLVSRLSAGLVLLHALYIAVPVAGVLALLALAASRRARYQLAQSLHPERRRLVRWARIMAWAGVYCAVTGGLALAVYGVLQWAQS